MAKTKTVRKKAYMCALEAKSQEEGQDSPGSLKRGFFCHILILFHLLIQNDLQ